jgi:lipopolysaccharide heptosyltransferase II
VLALPAGVLTVTAAARPEWSTAERVLCVRLDTIGDVLMTGPAMRALRESGAHPRITLLTSAPGAAVAELMPEVDEAIVYEAPWMKRGEGADAAADQAMIERLAARRFDAAAIFTVCTQSALPAALMCRLAGVPLRLAHSRERPYGLLTHHVPDGEPDERLRHEVRRQLDLVAAVGATTENERLALRVPSGTREQVAALLGRLGIDERSPWAVVHPGATAPSRRYPPERWAAVCRGLAEDHGVHPVLTGDPAEAELAGHILARSGVPGHSLAGRLDLGALAALIEAAPLLLAGNTGPVHIAAAVGTPVVDLYALTNPQHTPWGVPSRVLSHDVPCRWCLSSICPEGHHLCLRGVPPTEVVSAALELGRFSLLTA